MFTKFEFCAGGENSRLKGIFHWVLSFLSFGSKMNKGQGLLGTYSYVGSYYILRSVNYFMEIQINFSTIWGHENEMVSRLHLQ
ncbi:hypothetical protein K1719_022259 [Acacia pycnantha]|nr:hypothetical protein K1719_022259 [Acacia pycnantha]